MNPSASSIKSGAMDTFATACLDATDMHREAR